MKKFLCVFAMSLCVALPAQAHHSFSAQYDRDDEVKLDGTITKFEWTNPHGHVYVDVVSADGSKANWNLELASPNMLIRNGWKKNSLAVGMHIKASASRARDKSNTAAVVLITRDDGTELTFISGNDYERTPQ
jgi:hypothetical protein